eukprot:EG_transcript_15777
MGSPVQISHLWMVKNGLMTFRSTYRYEPMAGGLVGPSASSTSSSRLEVRLKHFITGPTGPPIVNTDRMAISSVALRMQSEFLNLTFKCSSLHRLTLAPTPGGNPSCPRTVRQSVQAVTHIFLALWRDAAFYLVEQFFLSVRSADWGCRSMTMTSMRWMSMMSMMSMRWMSMRWMSMMSMRWMRMR